MELNNYGLLLKRLRYQDIEMVRMWRNSETVKQHMAFKDHITIEMQKKWFKSLNPNCDYYFIIYHDNYPIGLTEVKNISNGKGNLGIFIADEETLTNVPMLSYKAIFTIIDFAFDELKLTNIEASILQNNTRAIRFNESFGFKIINNQDTVENKYYYLTKENYVEKSKKIRKIILRK